MCDGDDIVLNELHGYSHLRTFLPAVLAGQELARGGSLGGKI